MTTTLAAPVTSIALAALTPDVVRSCIVLQPSPPPEPGEEPPGAIGDNDIYTPVAPGVTYAGLPTVSIVDTSPDQLIGCIIDTAGNPQGRLNALFPAAIDGDGVIERSTNDIWVYDGSEWNNVGPTPGPTIVSATIIPPWNEILTYEARIRTRLLAQPLAYALQLLTEPDPLVVRTRLEAAVITSVKVPSTALTLQSPTLQVSISARVDTPVLDTQLSALPPAVAGGASVITSGTNTLLSGVAPDLVGRLRININVPASGAELTTGVATVVTGAVVGVPVRDITLSAVLPLSVGAPKDPDFASVSLLLPMNGANGSTTFTDSSSIGHTISVFGDAQVSTASPKFGTGALTLDGTGDYLTAPSESSLGFGTSNFTIECWGYFDSFGATQYIFSQRQTGGFSMLLLTDGRLSAVTPAVNTVSQSSVTMTTSTWHHLALVRNGSVYNVYVDGVKSPDTTLAGESGSTNVSYIGQRGDGTSFLNGKIDDLRITKGVARYTATFTPPTEAFPTS
jgi:hypothetical protein